MKKLVAVILVVLLCLSAMTACQSTKEVPGSNGGAKDNAPADNTGDNEKETQEPEKDPFAEGFSGYPMETDETLTFWTYQLVPHSEYTDASQSPSHQYFSEFTGVKIKWERPAAGADPLQAYNLMLASEDLPDVIFTDSLPSQCENLLDHETIIPMDDYMEKYAPNLYRRLKENPELDRAVKSDSGHYYNFPSIREDVNYLGTWQGPAVRKDLLELTGLDAPVTIADWDEMLHKFADHCDIPLSVYAGTQLLQWFGNSYGFNKPFHVGYYLDDNQKAKVWYNADGYDDFLVQMKKWYDDGLIDHDFVTMDMTGLVSKVAGNSVGSVYMGSGTVGRFKPALAEQGLEYNLIPASYPVSKEGDVIKYYQGEGVWNGVGGVITTNCKNVPLAMRFFDYGYSEEGIITYNFGKEGESFQFADGKPVFMDSITESAEGMTNALRRYSAAIADAPTLMLVDFYKQKTDPLGLECVDKWIENADGVSYNIPPVCATAEETTELSDLETAIRTYAEEMYYNFIMGSESLDKYDAYLKNLKDMGIDRVLEIKSKQLERYYAR